MLAYSQASKLMLSSVFTINKLFHDIVNVKCVHIHPISQETKLKGTFRIAKKIDFKTHIGYV